MKLGKLMKFEETTFAQRAAIRKLERVNGWDAVTITAHPCTDYDRTTINVVFDTGPRRMAFASVMLCSVGWSVTATDGLGKRILTEEEFDRASRIHGSGLAARLEELERLERLAA